MIYYTNSRDRLHVDEIPDMSEALRIIISSPFVKSKVEKKHQMRYRTAKMKLKVFTAGESLIEAKQRYNI